MAGTRKKDRALMEKIIEYSENFCFENKRSPSTSEIGAYFSIGKATAYRYLVEMNELGMISYSGNEIKTPLMEKCDYSLVRVPLVGRIICGEPDSPYEEREEYYALPKAIFGSDECFILRAYGDSMKNAGIEDGDMVVVKRQNTALKGDIVVALVGNETTLKRYVPEKGRIILHPENEEMEDIVVSECNIQGIAKHIIKKVK